MTAPDSLEKIVEEMREDLLGYDDALIARIEALIPSKAGVIPYLDPADVETLRAAVGYVSDATRDDLAAALRAIIEKVSK